MTIVAVECQEELVRDLMNDATFGDLEQPITQISMARLYAVFRNRTPTFVLHNT